MDSGGGKSNCRTPQRYGNCTTAPIFGDGRPDGHGGEEHVTDTPSMEACAAYVVQHHPNANAAPSPATHACLKQGKAGEIVC